MTRWKVSAKWIMKPHDCTLRGIVGRCGAYCCHSPLFWPPKAGAKANSACARLGPNGCSFTMPDRPITCLLYPLVLNKNGTIVLHHRTTTKTGICRGNHGIGEPIIVALRAQLEALFGPEQWQRCYDAVSTGTDGFFELSPELEAQWDREKKWEYDNVVPEARASAG